MVASTLHGGICPRAVAQGFSLRLDTVAAGYTQNGWGVLENADGQYVLSTNGEWVDSLFYSSVVTLLILDAAGTLVNADRIVAPLQATYPGESASLVYALDGGFVIGGSTYSTDEIYRPAIYWFDLLGNSMGFVQLDILDWFGGSQLKQATDGGFIMVGVGWIDDEILGYIKQGFMLKTVELGTWLLGNHAVGSASHTHDHGVKVPKPIDLRVPKAVPGRYRLLAALERYEVG